MKRFALAHALVLFCCLSAQAGQVLVAVAANFSAPMQQIATAFEQDSGHQVQLATGSTGKFYTQIVNGAPFDVLLAADDDTPARLEREGWGVPGTRFTYATGTLVLWSKQPNLVDTQGQVLKTAPFTRLAVADPKVAPYGAAALDTLAKLGLQSAWAPKLVQGDSVGQAYQFVASGNAALGFVALSQVWQDGKLKEGSAWLVPEHLHRPLRQDAVLLTPGRDNLAARALLQFLRSDHAQRVLRSYGYRP